MSDDYQPMMSEERARKLRDWHDANYRSPEHRQAVSTTYLGLQLEVPGDVHPPTRMSDLLGRTVLEEVRPDDRVLDMGTGSGVNAILAASRTCNVLAVDINPFAVECAKQNAARNGVSDSVTVIESDVFFFGTSGDSDYVHDLIEQARFTTEKLATRELSRDALDVEYFTYRLTLRP